jgi:hypothetical protein
MKCCIIRLCSAVVVATVVCAGPSAQAARPWLHQLDESQQGQLCSLILGYLSDEEIHWHMNIDHNDPQSFFHGHRAYIHRLEKYLQAQGAGHFVPLPKWDPGLAIPRAFRIARGDYEQPYNYDVGMPVPMAFRGPPLGQYGTLPSLYEAIRPYHNEVHTRVGGCMGDPMSAPAAPIFFCWHATLDDLFDEWAVFSGYQIPVSFEHEFPGHGGGHGSHSAPGGHESSDHGCVCGPKCGCGPNCQCPKRKVECGTGYQSKIKSVPPGHYGQGRVVVGHEKGGYGGGYDGYGKGGYAPLPYPKPGYDNYSKGGYGASPKGGYITFPKGGYEKGGYDTYPTGGYGGYDKSGYGGYGGYGKGGYSPGNYDGGYAPAGHGSGGYIAPGCKAGSCSSGKKYPY